VGKAWVQQAGYLGTTVADYELRLGGLLTKLTALGLRAVRRVAHFVIHCRN
jgi:hypothetical protein